MLTVKRSAVRIVSGSLICLLVASWWHALASGKQERAIPFPTEIIFSVGGESLSGDKNAAITDFAISPDGDKIAVGFKTHEPQNELKLWLGEWDLTSGKLLAKVRLDRSIPTTSWVGFASFFHNTIQYSSDGSKIIVRAGNDVYGLKSSNLAKLYSISPKTENSGTSNPFCQEFSISRDGKSLAVPVGQSELEGKLGTVYIYDANTGIERAHWSAPAQISNVCLSQDGDHVLLTAPHDSSDILLVDSFSGRVIKRFTSGFEHPAGSYAENALFNALFLDQDHFITSEPVNAKERSSAAKVFDLATGGATSQLVFGGSGSAQDIWLSQRNFEIAMLQSLRRSARIAFFHSNESRPFCALGPLPEKHELPHRSSGFIRLSANLKIVGLFMENRIRLYSTSKCTGSDSTG
jgi:hypothetical protein